MITQSEIQAINNQESLDAYVTSCIIKEKLGDLVTDLTFKEMPRGCHYDLVTTFTYKGKETKWAIEIKERNKTPWIKSKYPYAELKVAKYNYLMNSTKDFDGVYFFHLLNKEECYAYNMRKIDITQLTPIPWVTKDLQVSESSSSHVTLTYNLPYDWANKITEIGKYYE